MEQINVCNGSHGGYDDLYSVHMIGELACFEWGTVLGVSEGW